MYISTHNLNQLQIVLQVINLLNIISPSVAGFILAQCTPWWWSIFTEIFCGSAFNIYIKEYIWYCTFDWYNARIHWSEMQGMDSCKTRPTVFSDWAVVNNVWENLWKHKVFDHTKVLYRQFHEYTKESYERTQGGHSVFWSRFERSI